MFHTLRNLPIRIVRLFAALTLVAPLAKNKSVGKARVVVDGQTIATYDLFPTADVPAAGLFGRAWDSLRLLFH